MTDVQNFSRGARSGHEIHLLGRELGSLLLPVRAYIDELRAAEAAGETAPIGRCVRDEDGSTRTYERIRRMMKQQIEQQAARSDSTKIARAEIDLRILVPEELLPTIFRLTRGRHTSFPDPGTQKPGVDDLDTEWTTHLATKALLYRMAIGTGTNRNDNTPTHLGPPPKYRAGFLEVNDANLLYADVLRDLRGTSREPFDEEVLERFTMSHPGDRQYGMPLTSEQANRIADLQEIDAPLPAIRFPYMRAARATGVEL